MKAVTMGVRLGLYRLVQQQPVGVELSHATEEVRREY